MQFLWSWILPATIIIPLLIAAYIWAQRRRARFALRYSSLSLVKEAMGKGPGIRRHIPPLLFLLGIAAMLVALARPVAVATLPQQEGTVMLAIDVSGSMRADDMKPSRLEAAKAAARAFIAKQSPNTRIGIVAFSTIAALVQAPTTDRAAALAAVDRLMHERRTAVGSAILTSLDAIFEKPTTDDMPMSKPALSSAPAPKTTLSSGPTPTPTPVPRGTHVPAIIILLTDGQSNTGPSPLVAAQQAADRGVRVFTIGAGTVQGATLQGMGGSGFRTVLDEKALRQVAEITDAEYFHASNEQALIAIYQNLDTELILRTQKTEITAGFTAAAMLLLLIGGALSLLWFNRLP
jgi:Ca-activated chloride channel family protein